MTTWSPALFLRASQPGQAGRADGVVAEPMAFPLPHPPYVMDDPDSEAHHQEAFETTFRERFAGCMWRRVAGFRQ